MASRPPAAALAGYPGDWEYWGSLAAAPGAAATVNAGAVPREAGVVVLTSDSPVWVSFDNQNPGPGASSIFVPANAPVILPVSLVYDQAVFVFNPGAGAARFSANFLRPRPFEPIPGR